MAWSSVARVKKDISTSHQKHRKRNLQRRLSEKVGKLECEIAESKSIVGQLRNYIHEQEQDHLEKSQKFVSETTEGSTLYNQTFEDYSEQPEEHFIWSHQQTEAYETDD
nr:uncharacterized protein CI109_001944 [Kwoniella shandongensis]KAA5529519.1 hypothetical protein CI109_001944 [Kwoniella shandongensis]